MSSPSHSSLAICVSKASLVIAVAATCYYAVCGDLDEGFHTNNNGVPYPTASVTFEILTLPGLTTPAPTPAPVLGPTLAPVSGPTPSSGMWIEVDPAAPISKRHEACFVMVDSPIKGRKMYLVGGRGMKNTDIYDPVSRTWIQGARPGIELHHTQCVAAQGKLWIMAAWTGGFPKENNAPHVYVYDPDNDSWEEKTAMPENRRRGGAAVVVDSNEENIYVSHGNDGGHETGNHATSYGLLDKYTIATDQWTALPTAPNPRDHTCGAIVNGRLCVGGGRNGGEQGWPPVAPTDCYNFATETWQQEADIPIPRGGSSCGTSCDGKLIVAGGEGNGQAYKNVHVFDGSSWVEIDDLNLQRHGSGLAVDCVCNQIHIASGAKSQGGNQEMKSLETYFPNGIDVPCTSGFRALRGEEEVSSSALTTKIGFGVCLLVYCLLF